MQTWSTFPQRVSTPSRCSCASPWPTATAPVQSRDIAAFTGVPPKFLEQVMHDLRQAGLVASQRGKGGGYVLAVDPAALTFADVIDRIDGGRGRRLARGQGTNAGRDQAEALVAPVWSAVRGGRARCARLHDHRRRRRARHSRPDVLHLTGDDETMTDTEPPSTPRGFDTLAVHGGQAPDPTTGSRAVPIYQTTSYNFDTDHAADLFGLRVRQHLLADHEPDQRRARAARRRARGRRRPRSAVASGHAAESPAAVSTSPAPATTSSPPTSSTAAPGTSSCTRSPLGIEASLRRADRPGGLRGAHHDDARSAWFVETIGNPARRARTSRRVAAVARRGTGIPLFVDNTFATPYLVRPIEHGAAVVVESLTKWLGGHGTSIGGIIVDGGNFDWGNGRFPVFTEPDRATTACKFWDVFGDFPARQRRVDPAQLLRDLGAGARRRSTPFQFLLGVETLLLRVQRHSDNALAVAQVPRDAPEGGLGDLPGLLESHPTHANASKYLTGGYRGVVVFGVKGGLEAGKKLHRRREALQPPGQRRRREVAHHPSRDDDALAADGRGAAPAPA